MSLFADPAGQDPTNDLLTISWADPNLNAGPPVTQTIQTNIGPVDATQVTYPSVTTGQPTADRLLELVNTNSGLNWAFPILITPLDGGNDPYLPPGGPNTDITGNGHTYIDSSTNPPVIHVVYDIGLCNGAGIACVDTSNNPISTPTPVVLYHELSHAYHDAINQNPFPIPSGTCPTPPTDDEPAAEIDENVLRSQLGLCLRDVCNHHANCGAGDNCGGADSHTGLGGASGGGGGGGCFIVSAATQSRESAEVHRLRQLRGRVVSRSGLSGSLIDRIYREYYQFSPAIAAELEQDEVARTAALWMVVRPLLAWYTLAGALALDQIDGKALRLAVREVERACPRYLRGAGVAAVLEAVRSGNPLPKDSPELLRAFEPKLRKATGLPLASWALLDPLIRMWTLRARRADAVEEVSQWMATAPLEVIPLPSPLPCCPDSVDVELERLASFFNFRPLARWKLGARLAVAWPEAASALQRHGFIQQLEQVE
jgi:hypothetical protein